MSVVRHAVAPLVSIIVPHFQTPELARLCLRSIRRHTPRVPYEVIVVDNQSKDGRSLEVLRQVQWIRLIERTDNVGWLGLGHKEAMDLGIEAARGRYVMAFHTDTIPIRDDWLEFHVQAIEADPKIAAVGTYKLEIKSPWSGLARALENLRFWKRTDASKDEPYIRSHCALYRKDVLAKLGLKYNDPENDTAGRAIHFGLIRAGWRAELLSVDDTLERVVHLNHGTMVMLPELGAKGKTIRRGRSRISKFLLQPQIQALMRDDSLDRDLQPERA